MNKLIISVIVPIYKVEPYLHRCIDSIINQTYRNLEIILVDDGSPDRCGKICDEYAKHDNRIKVIHKENGGLSDARNAGMHIATGDYISFVDSDDYIAKESYEVLLHEAEKYQVDVLVGNANIVNEEKNENSLLLKDVSYDTIETGLEFMHRILLQKKGIPIPAWLQFIKLSSLKEMGLKFKKGYLHEDVLWSQQLFLYSKRVKFLNYPYYYYCLRKNSITNAAISKRGIFLLKIYCDLSATYKAIKNKEQRKILNNNISRSFLSCVSKAPLSEEPYKSFLHDKRFFPLILASSPYTYFGGILFAININLFAKTFKLLSSIKQFLKSLTFFNQILCENKKR